MYLASLPFFFLDDVRRRVWVFRKQGRCCPIRLKVTVLNMSLTVEYFACHEHKGPSKKGGLFVSFSLHTPSLVFFPTISRH